MYFVISCISMELNKKVIGYDTFWWQTHTTSGALIFPPLPTKCSYVGNEKFFGGTLNLKKEAAVSCETWVSV